MKKLFLIQYSICSEFHDSSFPLFLSEDEQVIHTLNDMGKSFLQKYPSLEEDFIKNAKETNSWNQEDFLNIRKSCIKQNFKTYSKYINSVDIDFLFVATPIDIV